MDAKDRRWTRYTLNRLAVRSDGTHIRDTNQCRYLGLRITHQQEGLVQRLMSPIFDNLPASVFAGHRYVLRRLVVGGPYFDEQSVRNVPQAEVEWWLRERLPLVVPPLGHATFPMRLWSTLRMIARVSPSGAVHVGRTTTPLLCHPSIDDVPEACQAFFRHYFATDALEYIHTVRDRMRRDNIGTTHGRQLWDSLRRLWLFLTDEKSGRPFHRRILWQSESVWAWLLGVYRRHGGGDPQALPSVCLRALAAARLAQEIADAPHRVARREYLARIHIAACVEEPLRLRGANVRTAGAAGTTYTTEECARLLAACVGPRDRFLMLLLQRVGLRNAALRGLMWHELVDAAPDHAVHVVASTHEKGGALRKFVLAQDPCLRDALKAHLQETLNTAPCWRWETACVFPHHVSEPDVPMSAGQIQYWFRCLSRRAGVQGSHVTLHHFRHYIVAGWATHRCVDVGVGIRFRRPS